MKKVGAEAKAEPTAKRVPNARGRRKSAAQETANTDTNTDTDTKGLPDPSERAPINARQGKQGPVVLLSGGNPQIAKAEGEAPVQAYIEALPGWKRDVGQRLDALIARNVPDVRKAVKWNSPFYGVEGQGWFLAFHAFTRYLKVTFFRGASLRPVPPGPSKDRDTRYLDIREGDELDELQIATWVKQAAAVPGFLGPRG